MNSKESNHIDSSFFNKQVNNYPIIIILVAHDNYVFQGKIEHINIFFIYSIIDMIDLFDCELFDDAIK